MWARRLLKNKKQTLPIDVRRSKTSLSSLIHVRYRSDNVLHFAEEDLGKNKMILEGEIKDAKM